MYYENFSQYVRSKTDRYSIDGIKDEGDFCKVIPDESMSVGELRNLFYYLNSIEDIDVCIDKPGYIIAKHDI